MTLSYKTRALSHEETGSWQIVIPPFTADEHIVSYDSSVTFPDSWGTPSFVSPQPSQRYWTIAEHQQDPIVLEFGTVIHLSTSSKGSGNITFDCRERHCGWYSRFWSPVLLLYAKASSTGK